MRKWSKKDNMQAYLGYILFSAVLMLFGWAIGAYDHDVREDGWTETRYHSPTGDSRY